MNFLFVWDKIGGNFALFTPNRKYKIINDLTEFAIYTADSCCNDGWRMTGLNENLAESIKEIYRIDKNP